MYITVANCTLAADGWYEHPPIETDSHLRIRVPRLRVLGDIITRGSIDADASIDTHGGDIFTRGGYIDIHGGYIFTHGGDIDTGGGDISTYGGRIETSGGDIFTRGGVIYNDDGDIDTGGGDISTYGGDIYTHGGPILTYGGRIVTSGGRLNGLLPLPPEQQEVNLRTIAPLALAERALAMGEVHTCHTVHCVAGWACYALPGGKDAEAAAGWFAAGWHLLGAEAAALFFATEHEARTFLRRYL